MTPREQAVADLVRRWKSPAKAAEVIREIQMAFPKDSTALRELEAFCRSGEDVGFDQSGQVAQRFLGRREVQLHIARLLTIDPEEVERISTDTKGQDDED